MYVSQLSSNLVSLFGELRFNSLGTLLYVCMTNATKLFRKDEFNE